MILNFEHRSAVHCETGVASNMLHYHGIDFINEPLVFGIGSGLFFVYMPSLLANSGMTTIAFRIIPGRIFANLMKNLRIKAGKKRFCNEEKAMKAVDELLAKGIPVGNVVGLYYLPYVPREIRSHFNAHNICVIGKEGDEYTVSDPLPPVVQKISYADLKKVRFTKGVFKPKGKMYWIKEMPGSTLDLHLAIVRGIKKTCYNMLDIPVRFLGVRGIALLAKRMRNWETKYGEKDALFHLAKMIQILEELGTGGAGFRFMYGAFLHEAADIIGESKLKDFAVEMNNIGNLWRNFALECGRKFKNRSTATYDDLADKLVEIAGKEKAFFISLRKFIKTECKK
jgi:hypothetical protein